MRKSVVIDCFAESVAHYAVGHAVVAVDVVRATTTIVTALVTGRSCWPAPNLGAAHRLAARLGDPLLAGEQRGDVPPGFDLNNSPAQLAARSDIERPVVLLSSSGTRVCHEAERAQAAFVGCLRNYSAVARALAGRYAQVAVIGAGSRGEFREEDQMCCAWIAERLIAFGYEARGAKTQALIAEWRDAPADAWLGGKSAAYLRDSGQLADLAYILAHVDDVDLACFMRNGEAVLATAAASTRAPPLGLAGHETW
jgi:2-phosphosulfolactate phosphatase